MLPSTIPININLEITMKGTTMKFITSLIAGLALATGLPVTALASSDITPPAAKSETQSNAAAPMTDGEVRKVDMAGKKITIKHGPLANLDMPAMTMVFRVKDPAMLNQVKTGDRIGFVAEMIEGKIAVTKLDVKN